MKHECKATRIEARWPGEPALSMYRRFDRRLATLGHDRNGSVTGRRHWSGFKGSPRRGRGRKAR